ncbi:MAG: hypothetical protein ACTHNL_03675, partial [Devosia sp.]
MSFTLCMARLVTRKGRPTPPQMSGKAFYRGACGNVHGIEGEQKRPSAWSLRFQGMGYGPRDAIRLEAILLRRIASRGAEFSERHGRAPASAGGNRTRPRL